MKKEGLKKHLKNNNQKSLNKLYLKYIAALIKSEEIQNQLEIACSNYSLNSRQTEALNNLLNNQLAIVMALQNAINYLISE